MDNIDVIDKVYFQFFEDTNSKTVSFANSVRKTFDNTEKINWYLLELQGKNSEQIVSITYKILADNQKLSLKSL